MLCKKAVSTRTVARKAAHGKHAKTTFTPAKRACTLALAVVTACSLSFPSLAFASVVVDEAELAQGENAIGGGTATLTDTSLDMSGVTADTLYTDDNDGEEVDLKADGEPAYYRCASDKPALRAMPQTNDDTNPFWPLAAGIASAMTAAYAARRREEQ